jgi:WD40 repeat protein
VTFADVLAEVLTAADAGAGRGVGWWAAKYPQFRPQLDEFFAAHATATYVFARVAPQPMPVPDLPGFVLHEELGRGGIGVVYRATQADPPREVAVKVLAAGPLASPASRERFRREAAAAARLTHPNIAQIYEVGDAHGLPYLVLRYYPGGPLGDRPGGYRDDPRTAAELVRALAAGVAHAHRHGILHRDLKPANVLLDESAVPAVCDFGLMAADWAGDGLTATRELVGTPHFMAPEQADPGVAPCTVATDVYGLGGVLYALLTGKPPADGRFLADVLARVRLLDPPAADVLNPKVPADLAAICRKCLEKSPHRRYPSADAVAADLTRFLTGRPTVARPLSRPRAAVRWGRRHPGPAAAAAAVLAAGGAAAYGWTVLVRHAAERQTADFYVDMARVRERRLTRPAGWARDNHTALHRLARLLPAAAEATALRTELAAVAAAVDFGEPARLAPGWLAYSLAYHPDGHTLAAGGWRADDGLVEVRLLAPHTGAVRHTLVFPADADWERRDGRNLTDGVRSLAFSPDGKWLAAGSRSGWVTVWDAEGVQVARWRHPADPAAEPRHERVDHLTFTPDGRAVVAVGGDVAAVVEVGPWAVRARTPFHHDTPFATRATPADPVRLTGREPREVVGRPPWLVPTGERPGEVYAAGPGWRVRLERQSADQLRLLAGGRPRAGDALRLPDADQVADGPLTTAAVTPDGRLAVLAAEHAEHLGLWEPAANRRLAVRRPRGSLRLALAPDGRAVAVAAESAVLVYPIEVGDGCRTRADGPPLVDADRHGDRLVTVARGDDDDGGAELTSWADGPAPGWAVNPHEAAGNNRKVAAAGPHGLTALATGEVVARVGPGRVEPIPGATFRNLRELAFAPDGRLWAAADTGLLVAAPHAGWRPASPGRDGATCLAVGPDGVVSGWDDGTLAWHHPETGAVTATRPVLAGEVTAVAAGDGLTLAGGADGELVILTADRVRRPAGHADRVTAVAVRPTYLATGGRDRVVKVWTRTGELLFELPQTRPVRRLFADPDRLTVLAEGERAVRVWDWAAVRRAFAAAGVPAGF